MEHALEDHGTEVPPREDGELDSWLECILEPDRLTEPERFEIVVSACLRAANAAQPPSATTPMQRRKLGPVLADREQHGAVPGPHHPAPLRDLEAVVTRCRRRDGLIDRQAVIDCADLIASFQPDEAISAVQYFLDERQGRDLDHMSRPILCAALADAFTRASRERHLASKQKRRYAQLAYCCARVSQFALSRLFIRPQLEDIEKTAAARTMVNFVKAFRVEADDASSVDRKHRLREYALHKIVQFVKDERVDIRSVGLSPGKLEDTSRLKSALDQVRLYLQLCREQYGLLRELYLASPGDLADVYVSVLNVNQAMQRYFRRNLYDADTVPAERRFLDYFSWDHLSQTPLVASALEGGESLLEDLYLTCIDVLTAMGEFFCEAGDTTWSCYANGLASHHWAQILVDPNTREALDPRDPRLLKRCEVEMRAARSLVELDPHWAQMKLAISRWAASRLRDIDEHRSECLLAENHVLRARIHLAFGRLDAASYALSEARQLLGSVETGVPNLPAEIDNLAYALAEVRRLLTDAGDGSPPPGPPADWEGTTPRWPVVVDRSLQGLLGIICDVASTTDAGESDGLDEAQKIVDGIGSTVVRIWERKGHIVTVPRLEEIARQQIGKRKRKRQKGPGRALIEAYRWVCDVTQRTLPLVALHVALTRGSPGGGASVGERLLGGADAMRKLMDDAAEQAEKHGHWLSAVECRLWLANASSQFKPDRWRQALQALDRWMAEVPAGVDRIRCQDRWWNQLQAAVAHVLKQGDPDLLPFAAEVGEKLRARSLLDAYDMGEAILEELQVSHTAALRMHSESLSGLGELVDIGGRASDRAPGQLYEQFAHILDWQHHSAWYRPAADTKTIRGYLTDRASTGQPMQIISFYTNADDGIEWLVQDLDGVRAGSLPVRAAEVRKIRSNLKRYASVADTKLKDAGTGWREAFEKLCEDDLCRYVAQLERLTTDVIRPIEEAGIELSDRVVTYFVANEDMLGLPLHAARDGQSEQFLIQRALIAYTPSASCLVRIAEQDDRPRKGAACLAYGPDLGMDSLLTQVGNWHLKGDSLEHFQAWCRQGPPAFEWLLLGGHGGMPGIGGDPWRAFIKLEDGDLKPLDLLHVSADFAFVGSCNVGKTHFVAAETYGFLFGLMSGGTRSCVLADMPVYVDVGSMAGPLAEMPRIVYEMTHAGKPKIEAYAEAMRNVIAGKWRHPYFWAPFHFYGDAGPLRRFSH